MKKIEVINFLRGYSIFTIALMHLLDSCVSGVLDKAAAFGGAGVHVFILCSGFGLYMSYLKKPLGYGEFLKRRFGKVWIPYAIAVLLWGVWLLIQNGVFPIKEVASHLLLYKMFSTELDTSLCYPYWFISTIVQFYLFWPFIVRIYRMRWGVITLLVISLLWSTIVGMLGLEEERPWGSFFLQYLWEFGVGMYIAEKVFKAYKVHDGNVNLMDIKSYSWWILLIGAVGGMGCSALMAWNGGVLKLYNDIPSLIGYLSVALLIYKVGVSFVNRFFEWANGFSYELYLVHSLVYVVMEYLFSDKLPMPLLLTVSFLAAYVVAYVYNVLTKKFVFVK